jgi:hypothetical protein
MGYTHAEALSVRSPLDALPIILPGVDTGSAVSTDRRPTALDDERQRRASLGPVYLAPVSLTQSKSAPNGKNCDRNGQPSTFNHHLPHGRPTALARAEKHV